MKIKSEFFLFSLSLFGIYSCIKHENASQSLKNHHTQSLLRSSTVVIANKSIKVLNSENKPFTVATIAQNRENNETTREPVLGQGFNSNSEEYLSQCVSDSDSEIIYNGQATTNPQQAVDMSYKDINNVLYGRANGSAEFSKFTANGEFEYSSQAQSTNNSVTFTHFVNYENIQLALGAPSLSQNAYSLINEDTKSVSQIANEVCGNSFVSGLVLGAKLIVTVKISLSNSVDAKDIKGKLDINVPNFGGIAGYITSIDDQTSKNKSISIYIKQIGGDESQLAQAIPTDAIHCGLEDVQSRTACLKTLAALLHYEKTVFIPSIENLKYEPTNFHGLAVISTKKSPYKNIPIQFTRSDNTKDGVILVSEKPIEQVEYNIIQSRQDLSSWYEFERNIYTRSRDLLTIRLGDFQKQQIENIQKSAQKNMKTYAFAGNSCYRDIVNCFTNKQEAVKNALKYDTSLLDTNSVVPLFDISGTWFNSALNKVMSIAQIGTDTDALYTAIQNNSEHDYGTFTAQNIVSSSTENIISKNLMTQEYCQVNKKKIYVLNQNNQIKYLTVFERILENKCEVNADECNLPGETKFSTMCVGIPYQNIDEPSLFNLI